MLSSNPQDEDEDADEESDEEGGGRLQPENLDVQYGNVWSFWSSVPTFSIQSWNDRSIDGIPVGSN